LSALRSDERGGAELDIEADFDAAKTVADPIERGSSERLSAEWIESLAPTRASPTAGASDTVDGNHRAAHARGRLPPRHEGRALVVSRDDARVSAAIGDLRRRADLVLTTQSMAQPLVPAPAIARGNLMPSLSLRARDRGAAAVEPATRDRLAGDGRDFIGDRNTRAQQT